MGYLDFLENLEDVTYMEFLRSLDEQTKKLPGKREQVKKILFQAWSMAFPKDSIPLFCKNVYNLVHKFPFEEWVIACDVVSDALRNTWVNWTREMSI